MEIEGIHKLDYRAAADGELTVYLYGEIQSWTATDFTHLFAHMKQAGTSVLHLRLNGPGGNVFGGNAIANLIRQSPTHVITYNDGHAASMMSVILFAGNEVRAARNALTMIHNPGGTIKGDAEAHRSAADLLDKMAKGLADAYAARGSKSAEEYLGLMKSTKWYTAEEALAEGLIDGIYDSEVESPTGIDRTSPQALDELTFHFAAQLVAPAPATPNFLNMDTKKLAIMLGLDSAATEDQIEAKLKEVQAQAATVEDLQNEVKIQREASIKALVDGAVADGRILEEQRQIYTANARNDFDLTSQILGGMAARPSITDALRGAQGSLKTTVPGEKKFKELTKAEIETLRTEDWDKYSALYKVEFGYTPQKTEQVKLSS